MRLQSLFCAWFDQHEDEWQIIGGPEARRRLSPIRVRLPGIAMIPAGPAPQTLVEPPLIVIEILSPIDSHSELEDRMRDYVRWGPERLDDRSTAENCARLCHGSS